MMSTVTTMTWAGKFDELRRSVWTRSSPLATRCCPSFTARCLQHLSVASRYDSLTSAPPPPSPSSSSMHLASFYVRSPHLCVHLKLTPSVTSVSSGEGGKREGGCFPRLSVAAKTDQTCSELVSWSGCYGAGRHAAHHAAESGDPLSAHPTAVLKLLTREYKNKMYRMY